VTPASITTNKDFKVKHGLSVAEGGTFGSPVTVGTPISNAHAATKLYVDDAVTGYAVPQYAEAPASADEGQLYIDPVTKRVSFYLDNEWITIATLNDTLELQQHIHDTAIDGTGLIVSILKDGGYYNEAGGTPEDAGYYNSNNWATTYDGGIAIDNFN
jgi:hypothetical protein